MKSKEIEFKLSGVLQDVLSTLHTRNIMKNLESLSLSSVLNKVKNELTQNSLINRVQYGTQSK
jgi:hypothetical protein